MRLDEVDKGELKELQKNDNRVFSNKGNIKVTDVEFYELYSKGYTDQQVADLVGVNKSSIRRRRMYLNLSPNGKVWGRIQEVTNFKTYFEAIRDYNRNRARKPESLVKKKEYYLKNIENLKECWKKYQEKNKEQIKEYRKVYYLKNKENLKEYQKEYNERRKSSQRHKSDK